MNQTEIKTKFPIKQGDEHSTKNNPNHACYHDYFNCKICKFLERTFIQNVQIES